MQPHLLPTVGEARKPDLSRAVGTEECYPFGIGSQLEHGITMDIPTQRPLSP